MSCSCSGPGMPSTAVPRHIQPAIPNIITFQGKTQRKSPETSRFQDFLLVETTELESVTFRV